MAPSVISTKAKRSGEISPSDGTGHYVEYHQSVFHLPHTDMHLRSRWRYWRAPLSSFRPKRSGVEKSPPLMVRAALRWEISRLRVSSKRFPSAPYRHASPLEMTMLASAPLVISTEALRSGEISPPDGTGGITLGDLSTQSFIKAFSICPIPTCISARDDDVGERPSRHFDQSEAEWRNPSDGMCGITLGDFRAQSFIKAFSICPIPTCISARDDGVGERPSRHFDRSEAEWRNLSL